MFQAGAYVESLFKACITQPCLVQLTPSTMTSPPAGIVRATSIQAAASRWLSSGGGEDAHERKHSPCGDITVWWTVTIRLIAEGRTSGGAVVVDRGARTCNSGGNRTDEQIPPSMHLPAAHLFIVSLRLEEGGINHSYPISSMSHNHQHMKRGRMYRHGDMAMLEGSPNGADDVMSLEQKG